MVDLRHLQVLHGLRYDWWQVIDGHFYSAEKRVGISRKVDCCIRRIGKDHSLLILCMLFFTTFLIYHAIDFLSFFFTEISHAASLRRLLDVSRKMFCLCATTEAEELVVRSSLFKFAASEDKCYIGWHVKNCMR